MFPAPSIPVFSGQTGFRPEDSREGERGRNGGDGGDGPILDFDISYYNTEGTSYAEKTALLIIYERNSQKVWLIDPKAMLTISVIRGTGGRSGRCGDVRLYFPQGCDFSDKIQVNASGGLGDEGGPGGSGEDNEKHEGFFGIIDVLASNDGHAGYRGNNGLNGRTSREYILLDKMFLGLSSPLFEQSRLMSLLE